MYAQPNKLRSMAAFYTVPKISPDFQTKCSSNCLGVFKTHNETVSIIIWQVTLNICTVTKLNVFYGVTVWRMKPTTKSHTHNQIHLKCTQLEPPIYRIQYHHQIYLVHRFVCILEVLCDVNVYRNKLTRYCVSVHICELYVVWLMCLVNCGQSNYNQMLDLLAYSLHKRLCRE